MDVDLTCISLNVRGFRDITKRKSIFLFCKGKKANLILLQETRSKPDDEKCWSNQWGDKIIFDHCSTKPAGLANLFCNFPGKVVSSQSSNNGHWLICVLNIDGRYSIIVNVYGFNNPAQN